MAKIVFYCNDTKSNIQNFEYYKQDIDALKALGHDVVVCNRYREIPFTFDAIFIWWWTFALVPVVVARLKNRPSFVTGTYNFKFPAEYVTGDYFSRPPWQRLLIRLATQWCTRNLFVDKRELDTCSSYFKLNNGRSFPHVLDIDYLQGPATDRQMVLFNLAWSGKNNLIRKGIPEVLEAVAMLKEQGIAVTLKLAGLEGDGAQFLRDLIVAHGIQDEVEWLGPVSRARKIELLRSCEIYVQPSRYEGFGLAMAEAMGSGACVITCDVGAVRSVVGDCGIYVTPGRPDELAAAIKMVLEDSSRRKEIQANAYRRARTEFRFESKLKRLQAYMSEVGIV
jgi:glycosyltransferase involved in cell wall biosynthesis